MCRGCAVYVHGRRNKGEGCSSSMFVLCERLCLFRCEQMLSPYWAPVCLWLACGLLCAPLFLFVCAVSPSAFRQPVPCAWCPLPSPAPQTYRVCDGIVDGLDVIDGAWGDTYASTFGGGGGDGLARLLSPPSNLVVAAASANVVTLWGLDLKVSVCGCSVHVCVCVCVGANRGY